MKYIVLVSHGEFAEGLANALSMLAGQREDLLAAGLHSDMSADQFAEVFAKLIENVKDEDEILLFGDLIGGSPLTTACNVLAENGNLANVRVIGGMNLPVVLSALLMKDAFDLEGLKEAALSEGASALKEFAISVQDEEDDI